MFGSGRPTRGTTGAKVFSFAGTILPCLAVNYYLETTARNYRLVAILTLLRSKVTKKWCDQKLKFHQNAFGIGPCWKAYDFF